MVDKPVPSLHHDIGDVIVEPTPGQPDHHTTAIAPMMVSLR
jgi:hypothetical protein